MKTTPKNFRLGEQTIQKMEECMDDLGLTTSVMAIRVAIEELHARRHDPNLDITRHLVAIRRYEREDRGA